MSPRRALHRLEIIALVALVGPQVGDGPRAVWAASCAAGPCNRPEMVQLVLPDTGETLMLTNFGMLLPRTDPHAEGKYDLLCEEAFGGKVPPRVTRHPDGRLFFPGVDGLYVTADRCGFQRAAGSVERRELTEVAVDPDDPTLVWALGNTPARLHLSVDGGATFSERQSFAPEVRATRLVLGPTPPAGQPRTVVVAGYTSAHPLALLVSEDQGQSFTTRLGTRELFARPGTGTHLLALVPPAGAGAPAALLLAAGSPQGPDQIWRSVDLGVSWIMTFALAGMEVQSGFTFQPETGTIYLAGRELYVDPGKPPAQLYRSTDGGLTFAAPVPSGEQGPRYRCLASKGDRLYACAGEPGDSFLAGHSDDGGRTWTPLAQLFDVEGQRVCPGNGCLSTAVWLCRFYGAACEGLGALDGGVVDARDAGPAEGGAEPPRRAGDGGCGCRLGAGAPVPGVGLLLLVAVALMFAAGRPRRRH